MADNVTLNVSSGGPIVRAIDRGDGFERQVVQLDFGGASGNAESLVAAGNGLPITFDQTTPGTTESVTVKASGGVGSLTETAPTTDTASSGLNGRLQRIAQRITSLIALIPSGLTGAGNFKVAVNEGTIRDPGVSPTAFSSSTLGISAAAAFSAVTAGANYFITNTSTSGQVIYVNNTTTAVASTTGGIGILPGQTWTCPFRVTTAPSVIASAAAASYYGEYA